MINGCYLLPEAEFYVAINNKGLWPNLKILPNKEIAAATYNHPSHGFGCGNIELWVSADQGKSWSFRSVVSDHSENPALTRMNHAMGLNARGELIALISGWSEGRKAPKLPVQVCVSSDNGQTWRRRIIKNDLVPFGDILLERDNSLVCSMYGREKSGNVECLFFRGSEDGARWSEIGKIADNHGEVAPIRLNDGEYLAAARNINNAGEIGGFTQFYKSKNQGAEWGKGAQISLPMQCPAHLLRLQDGRILLAYGTRISGLYGVMMRISKDDGKNWSLPRPLVTIPERSDCGYPSSVQVEDGTIVTAYYFGPKMTPICLPHGAPWNRSYHMGVARWRLKDGTFTEHERPGIIEY